MAIWLDRSLVGNTRVSPPPGTLAWWPNALPPANALVRDGSVLLQAAYPDLFAVIGTTFNTGGELPTEFRLPDDRGLFHAGSGLGTAVPGLVPRAFNTLGGSDSVTLTVGEMPSHTHVQNSHNHLQDAHTHLQDAHTHTQDAHDHSVTDPGHNHTQNSHNHTQDAHSHGVTDPGHAHTILGFNDTVNDGRPTLTGNAETWSEATQSNTTGISINNATATNQAATATNISNTTGVTVASTTATNQNTTATNQNTTATNQATTAVNQNEGGGAAHENRPPVRYYLPIIYY